MPRRLLWLLISLPVIVAWGFVLFVCGYWYFQGLYFAKGMHVFGFIPHLSFGAIMLLSAMVVSLLALRALRKTLQRRGKLAVTCLYSVTFITAIAAPCLMWASFETGRSCAYGRIDCRLLLDDCRALVAAIPGQDGRTDIVLDAEKLGVQTAATYLRSLAPIQVQIRERALVIRMDGGGVMYHEGLFVPLAPPPRDIPEFGRKHGLRTLDSRYPVYQYRVDDERDLLDLVPQQEGKSNERPD